jgi:superfamily I DNA and/or RNA helicase
MNPNDKLLLLFNKTKSSWEDATEKVVSFKETYKYGNHSGYMVTFTSGKTYPYNRMSLKFYTDPIQLDIKDKDVYVDNQLYMDIQKILQFVHVYKIFHKSGNTTLSFKVSLKEKNTNSQTGILNYYKDLAYYAHKYANNDDSIQSFIHNQYQNIHKVDKESALFAFTTGIHQTHNNTLTPIFPFEFNQSQKSSLMAALNNQVSIIEGPPGCGKTQVILNILMNLIYQDKKVAVVSNNNTAIQNVLEKLQESHLDFLCAKLGNSENKSNFFLEQFNISSQQKYMEDFQNYDPQKSSQFVLYANNQLLDTLHNKENELSQLKIQLEQIKKEYEHYQVKFNEEIETNLLQLYNRTSEQYLNAKSFIESTRLWGFWNKLKLQWIHKISPKRLNSINSLIIQLENAYYKSKLEELNQNIEYVELYLKQNDFNQIKSNYIEKSKGLLFEKLKQSHLLYRKETYTIDDYKLHFDEFIKQFPILLSTSHSLINSIDKDMLFDYLIVDEASQSELLSSVLAMSAAKNIIIVGDSKQLDQIDDDGLKDISIKLAEKYRVTGAYLYNNNSLLGSIKQVFPKAPVTLLKEHYRCHPTIINFLNQKFYDNELIVMTTMTKNEPIELIQLVSGNHARKNPNGSGMYSQREIDEVYAYIQEHPIKDLGIITPFRIQAQKYAEKFEDDLSIEADTVHRFQGRQKNTIVLSTVVNSIEKTEQNERLIDFINNPKLFNVALSRAKHKVILVGSEGLFNSKNNHFSDFIQYARYQTDFTKLTKATVTSVFDSLYEASNKQIQNNKLIITEQLILDLINEILKQYTNLKVSMHVSLNKLLSSYDSFNEQEQNYLKHNLAHVDFLIYNNTTKMNVLAIEVDGIQYHEQSEKQSLRDAIKNKAFELNQIPLLRLKTNGSNEKNLIESKLQSILAEN